MPALIKAVRPYASRGAFARDAARLALEGGPVRGDPPIYGRDPGVDVLRWPEDVRACDSDGPECRADCKGQSIRAAREAYDRGHRVELVITTVGRPAHLAVRVDGILVDPSEEAGAPHVPPEVWAGALIVGLE